MKQVRGGRWLLLALLLAASSCLKTQQLQDKDFVANVLAEYDYQAARYERLCRPRVGPTDCAGFQAALVALDGQLDEPNKIRKIGRLPPQERKELERLLATLRAF